MKRVDGFTVSGRLKPVGQEMCESMSCFSPMQVRDDAEYVDFSRLTIEVWGSQDYRAYLDGDRRRIERGHGLDSVVRKQLVACPELAISCAQRELICDNAFEITWVYRNADARVQHVVTPLLPDELKAMRSPAFRASDFRCVRPVGMWSSAHPHEIAVVAAQPDAEPRRPEYARFYYLLDVPLTAEGRERKARLFAAVREHLPDEPMVTALAPLKLALKEIKLELQVTISSTHAGAYSASFKVLDMLACRPGLAMNAEFVAQAMDYDGAWEVLRRETLNIMEAKR